MTHSQASSVVLFIMVVSIAYALTDWFVLQWLGILSLIVAHVVATSRSHDAKVRRTR